MPAPKRKQRQPSATKNVGKKRKKAADTEAGIETDQFFMDSDPEPQEGADVDIENTETAEEKRLRLGCSLDHTSVLLSVLCCAISSHMPTP